MYAYVGYTIVKIILYIVNEKTRKQSRTGCAKTRRGLSMAQICTRERLKSPFTWQGRRLANWHRRHGNLLGHPDTGHGTVVGPNHLHIKRRGTYVEISYRHIHLLACHTMSIPIESGLLSNLASRCCLLAWLLRQRQPLSLAKLYKNWNPWNPFLITLITSVKLMRGVECYQYCDGTLWSGKLVQTRKQHCNALHSLHLLLRCEPALLANSVYDPCSVASAADGLARSLNDLNGFCLALGIAPNHHPIPYPYHIPRYTTSLL